MEVLHSHKMDFTNPAFSLYACAETFSSPVPLQFRAECAGVLASYWLNAATVCQTFSSVFIKAVVPELELEVIT